MKRILPAILLSMMLAAPARGAAPASSEPTRFMRYVEEPDGSARLEAAEATYTRNDGVVVHLIGAVHIADAEFFAGLDESFAHYDALLYEMVKPRELMEAAAPAPAGGGAPMAPAHPPAVRVPQTRPTRAPSLAWVGTTQRFLRDRLHLTFQLEEIDYDRPNFVHADLDAQTFAELQADRGESMFTLMLRATMNNMAKSAAKGPDLTGFQLLGALFSPDQPQELKRVLAQQFGDLDDQMDAIEGPNGSVIVAERNKVALRVLREQIALKKKYIGIFYGAAHLKLMEKSLLEMGFHKVGVTWRTAWDIGPAAAIPTTKPVTPAPARKP